MIDYEKLKLANKLAETKITPSAKPTVLTMPFLVPVAFEMFVNGGMQGVTIPLEEYEIFVHPEQIITIKAKVRNTSTEDKLVTENSCDEKLTTDLSCDSDEKPTASCCACHAGGQEECYQPKDKCQHPNKCLGIGWEHSYCHKCRSYQWQETLLLDPQVCHK